MVDFLESPSLTSQNSPVCPKMQLLHVQATNLVDSGPDMGKVQYLQAGMFRGFLPFPFLEPSIVAGSMKATKATSHMQLLLLGKSSDPLIFFSHDTAGQPLSCNEGNWAWTLLLLRSSAVKRLQLDMVSFNVLAKAAEKAGATPQK